MSSLKKKFPVKQLQVELIEPFIFSNHIYELYNGIYCNLCIRAYKFIMLDCDHEKISNILIESKKLINKKLSLFYGIQIETFKPKKEHYFYLITEMLENDISENEDIDLISEKHDTFIIYNDINENPCHDKRFVNITIKNIKDSNNDNLVLTRNQSYSTPRIVTIVNNNK